MPTVDSRKTWSRPRFAFRSPFDQTLWFRSIITQKRSVTRVPDDDGTAISAAAVGNAAHGVQMA
jgi:hypothetical protein